MGTPKRRKTLTGHLEMGNADEAEEMGPSFDMEGPVAIMWDIENCPIPAGVPPLNVSGNIRNSLLIHGGVKGAITTFSAYGDYSRMSKDIREGCQKTGVNLIDVPNGKKDAADKAILIDMFLFAVDNRPPALILLISGDVDFAPALHKLRQRGYTIAVALPRISVHSALSNAGRFVWDWHNMASNEGLGTISRFNLDNMAAHFTNSSLTGGECQGHQPEPRNANDMGKHGLCFEAKGVNSTSPEKTGDISAFKDEILRLVSMNGGKLPLADLATSYSRAFREDFSLVKYGYRKLESLIQEMGDLCMEGNGEKKYVYIKVADNLDISIDTNADERNKTDVGRHGLCLEAKGVNSTSPGQTGDISALKDEILRVVSMNGGKLPLANLAASYSRAFRKNFSLVKYGYRKLQSLIEEMGDLCMEGNGEKRYVYIKVSDNLDISIDTNANKRKRTDMDKHGLCLEKKGVNSTSPGQTGDISALKDEILRVVSMNGGKLPLANLAASYSRAFRKNFSLVKYGYRKLQSLIEEMEDLCMEGNGEKMYVTIKVADNL